MLNKPSLSGIELSISSDLSFGGLIEKIESTYTGTHSFVLALRSISVIYSNKSLSVLKLALIPEILRVLDPDPSSVHQIRYTLSNMSNQSHLFALNATQNPNSLVSSFTLLIHRQSHPLYLK